MQISTYERKQHFVKKNILYQSTWIFILNLKMQESSIFFHINWFHEAWKDTMSGRIIGLAFCIKIPKIPLQTMQNFQWHWWWCWWCRDSWHVVSPKNVNRYVVKKNSKNYYRFIKFVSSKQVETQTTNRRSKAVVFLTTEIFVVKSETSVVIPFTTIFDALL